MSAKKIWIIMDKAGKPIAATSFPETAQSMAASGKGFRTMSVPRVRDHSSISLEAKTEEITDNIVRSAIAAKLAGTALSKFAKERGYRYDVLREAVNTAWGPSTPWPKVEKPKKA